MCHGKKCRRQFRNKNPASINAIKKKLQKNFERPIYP